MLLGVLGQLDVPYREQNRLLIAAGHAPAYPERSLDDPDLAPVREALEVILSGHEPYPAVAVDRVWNLVAANSPMRALTESVEIEPSLLEPPINVIRLGLHPQGLGPLFVNLGHWHAHWLDRLGRQLTATGDSDSPPLSTRSPPTRSRSRMATATARLPPARCSVPSGCALPRVVSSPSSACLPASTPRSR